MLDIAIALCCGHVYNYIWHDEFFYAFYSHPSIVRASVSTQEPSVMNRKTSAVTYPVRTVETAPTITQETHLFVPAQQVCFLCFCEVFYEGF